MVAKIAVNGFGRIGRAFLRATLADKEFGKAFEIVAINDLADARTLAHLLKRDSVHGTLEANVTASQTTLAVEGNEITVFAEKDPLNLPWKSLGIQFVLESTGLYTERNAVSKHLTAGAKKVLLSAPASSADATLVMGVNHEQYDPLKHHLVSMGSCTTNSLAPMAKVLLDNFGINKGYMTAVHAYTNDQRILDLPHKDLRRARAAALNIIPTSTGAAKAVSEVIPELKGKMDGVALRVPVPDGSITDLTCELGREATRDEVNSAFKAAASGKMKGVLQYTEEPLVSSDIVGNSHTSIIDGEKTLVLGNKSNLVKTFSWYDNEWGYSVKLVEMLKHMAARQ
ncbi:type I glyceraldehyde-3-phosphate dehydrogenase [Candidatus Micrarchaeota archaeon CG1_02_51_15]|nr:MAG: type I glyceraldehyde-3-phosphate dehydrogenase [Candidatus Micrarchaeota archaeon CG1_02_51_15]